MLFRSIEAGADRTVLHTVDSQGTTTGQERTCGRDRQLDTEVKRAWKLVYTGFRVTLSMCVCVREREGQNESKERDGN